MFSGLHHGLAKFNSTTTPELWAISSKVSLFTLFPVLSTNKLQSTIAATILCLLSLALAKCSVLALILRVIGPKGGWNRPACLGLMYLSVAWGVGSSIAFLANCRADSILTTHNTIQCPSQVRQPPITLNHLPSLTVAEYPLASHHYYRPPHRVSLLGPGRTPNHSRQHQIQLQIPSHPRLFIPPPSHHTLHPPSHIFLGLPYLRRAAVPNHQ